MNDLTKSFGLKYNYHQHIPIITGIDKHYGPFEMTDFFMIGLYENTWMIGEGFAVYEYKVQSANIR